ncbi:glycosylphosphatidylinositol anchor attachment 1 protein [Phlebotomus argentipes]|uniref:glycosylphosphatidylinositol anchor attachment 1 protein n=1 Tax=Phlebotomus argentipes TaxID=94469 RepID=UPI002892AA8A|nr:glycosylphosphatidylinositol anchor attachment 1 protein [Phlebotomus argentipes]
MANMAPRGREKAFSRALRIGFFPESRPKVRLCDAEKIINKSEFSSVSFSLENSVKFPLNRAMGLLTDPSALSQKTKYAKLLQKHCKLLCNLLFLGGVCWFVALTDTSLNHGTYFSENALLPGLVYSNLKKETMSFAATLQGDFSRERESHQNTMPTSWLLAKMKQIGLDAATHNFTLHYPFGGGKVFTGQNVYGILRAPRIGSTEAIVISCPYRAATSVHPEISHSVALMLAFADHARRQKYWAKDIIFLVTDQEQLGMQAWLNAYYGNEDNSVLLTSDLPLRAGAIQAALNIEMQSFDLDFINIKLEGLNGQLPNLDLFNLVQKLTNKEGILCGYKQTRTKRPNGGHVNNLWQMLTMVLSQSTGVPTGNHGLFHRFGIEAVTLEGVAMDSEVPPTGQSLQQMLRILEGITRSLNNLLERFHQSFFFYLIISNDRFVSIGDYMPCIGFTAGALLIKAFIMWLAHNRTDSEAAEEDAKTPPSAPTNLMKIGVLCIFAHAMGFVVNYLPFYHGVTEFFHQRAFTTEHALATLLAIVSVVVLLSCLFFRLDEADAKVLHIWILLELATALIVVGMLNFSLGLILAFVIVPILINVEISHNRIIKFAQQLCGILLQPLIVAYLAVFTLTWITFDELSLMSVSQKALSATMNALVYSAVDSVIYGNWMFNMISLVFFPIWILMWNFLTWRRGEREIDGGKMQKAVEKKKTK